MNKRAITFIILGLVFIAAAGGIVYYNYLENRRAGEESKLVLTQLEEATSHTELLGEDERMPVISIDGKDYVGRLSADSVGIDLPVLAQYADEDIEVAPCRYYGSAYTDTMVLCGHNMQTLFSPLLSLEIGDEVTFTDVNGNVFTYEVVQMFNLKPTAVQEMITGDWDLTLFTCTYSGLERYTVRCIRK